MVSQVLQKLFQDSWRKVQVQMTSRARALVIQIIIALGASLILILLPANQRQLSTLAPANLKHQSYFWYSLSSKKESILYTMTPQTRAEESARWIETAGWSKRDNGSYTRCDGNRKGATANHTQVLLEGWSIEGLSRQFLEVGDYIPSSMFLILVTVFQY